MESFTHSRHEALKEQHYDDVLPASSALHVHAFMTIFSSGVCETTEKIPEPHHVNQGT